MADTCPYCSLYDPRNVSNLLYCWDCTRKRIGAIGEASEEDIEKLREKNRANRRRRR